MSDKKEIAVKPVVHFMGQATLHKHSNGKESATVKNVIDHPRLGEQETVYTSEVLEVDDRDNPTLIHTRNTIYKHTNRNLV